MKAISLDGNEIEIQRQAVDDLRSALNGSLFFPGDVEYDASRMIWNVMIDRKPALIARCLGVSDVIACVRFAREHHLLLCIKGGGHNVAGLAAANGALMLDMSLMRGVWVDPVQKIAHAQAGCLLGDVDRETQLYGLAAPLGTISQTGIAGLTLGGGFGHLSRQYGWTADNLVSMDVVTADARLVHASMTENKDLFWGLRGGGGNFGVVTQFDYKLYPVGPEVVGGMVFWPASEAVKVFELYRMLAESAPRELSLFILMRRAPVSPLLPIEMHGNPIIVLGACCTDNIEEAERRVAPIKAFGSPIADTLKRQSYLKVQSMFDAFQPDGRRQYWKSEYFRNLEPYLGEKLVEHALRICSPHSMLFLEDISGSLNDQPVDYSPVGNRDARYIYLILASWEQANDDAQNIDWARAAWKDIQPYTTGGNYLNALSEDDGKDRKVAALGHHLQRLSEIKAQWDPANMFRTNHNILPAALPNKMV